MEEQIQFNGEFELIEQYKENEYFKVNENEYFSKWMDKLDSDTMNNSDDITEKRSHKKKCE